MLCVFGSSSGRFTAFAGAFKPRLKQLRPATAATLVFIKSLRLSFAERSLFIFRSFQISGGAPHGLNQLALRTQAHTTLTHNAQELKNVSLQFERLLAWLKGEPWRSLGENS